MTSFRDITDADVEAVVALWQACGLTRPWNDPYKDISFARRSENATVLVLAHDGHIVASAMAGHDGHRGVLYYVAVDPARQRQGLGKAAVRAGEEWLRARGVWKVNLLVRDENAAARGFYEALGYGVNPVISMARTIIEN
ncbi:MAG: GNAT family acetyltransferase [Aestuariivirga sp.]|jgi:ribosomal protein S18 acetylase RimI-like enzyme|uniref:GNAT family acetyltransferase n=1 Tax=Aestuariivirga sp. TaxID=2650926 RepID=UPI003018614A